MGGVLVPCCDLLGLCDHARSIVTNGPLLLHFRYGTDKVSLDR